jgi:hypothetical protein
MKTLTIKCFEVPQNYGDDPPKWYWQLLDGGEYVVESDLVEKDKLQRHIERCLGCKIDTTHKVAVRAINLIGSLEAQISPWQQIIDLEDFPF